MRTLSIILVALCCLVQVAVSQVVTSVAAGSLSNPNTWDCTCIPGTLNDLVIQHAITQTSGATFNSMHIQSGGSWTHNSAGNTIINGDFTVDAGTVATNDRRLDIYGNYTINGEHAGTGHIRIRGTGNILSGSPTGYISNTARFILRDGNKQISSGSSLTKNTGQTRVNSGIQVDNHGAYQGSAFRGSGGATWVNRSGSWLAVRRSWNTNLSLDAQASGNIVVYNRVGTSNQVVADPVNSVYHDLEILGTSTSGLKRLRNDVTIKDDLTIGTSTFVPKRSGITHDITIYGDWNNTSGVFRPRTSQVEMIANSGRTISCHAAETFHNLILSGTDTVTLNAPIDLSGSLTVNSTLDADPAMSHAMDVEGNFDLNGSFIPRFGTVKIDGTGASDIDGDVVFHELEIDGSGGATIQSGSVEIKGTLTLTNGNLETNDILTLRSDESGTARIGTVTGGSMSGSITAQRYIDAGATNWRFLSSPVTGQSLASWDDDFITSGFTGSDFPSFPFTSIYTYDESQPGGEDDGFVAAVADTDPINVGEGYWVWCGDSLGGTAPFTIDVHGPANIGNTDLAVQYTTVSGPTGDGWCMAGNPYASTIDWDSPNWTKTNIDDAVYIWDPDNQQFASYVNGVGNNGGSPYIASSQAFWVKANASSPQLQAKETVKSAVDPIFKSNPVLDGITLLLSGNGYSDETVVRTHTDASELFDPALDALKMFSSNPNVPSINTQILGDVDMAINSIPVVSSDISIPVRTLAGASGNQTIEVVNVSGEFTASCIILEDTYTGDMTSMTDGATYTFNLSDTTNTARFMLHIGVAVDNTVFNTTCAGMSNGSALATGAGPGPWDYTWFDDQGTVIQSNVAVSGPALISDLSAGTYSVQVSSIGNCPSVDIPFNVIDPPVLTVGYNLANASCESSPDGNIDLQGAGGTAPYIYSWSNGSTDEDQSDLVAGTYSVNILDQNQCAQDLSFDVEFSFDPQAAFTISTTELYMSNGAEVQCTNTSVDAVEYRWNFGDGSPVQFGTDAIHQYSTAGDHTVSLRALNMDCFSDISMNVTVVDDVTGIDDLSNMEGIFVEQTDQGVFLVFDLSEPTDLNIRSFNTLGQEVEEVRTGTFQYQRIEIADELEERVLIVAVYNELTGEKFTKKVVR